MQTAGFDSTAMIIPIPKQEEGKEPSMWIGIGRGTGADFVEVWWPGYARVGVSAGQRAFLLPASSTRDSVRGASSCPKCQDPACENWGVVLTDIAIFTTEGQMVGGASMFGSYFLQPGQAFNLDMARL